MEKKNYMQNKNYMLRASLLMLGYLCFYSCSGQELGNDQLQDSAQQVVEAISVSTIKPDVKAEVDLLKKVRKFIVEIKQAGLIDKKLAKLLFAYSTLNENLTVEDVQKIITAAGIAGLSNETRSINLTTPADNKSSSGEKILWTGGFLLLVAVVCVLVWMTYDQYYNSKTKRAERAVDGAAEWMGAFGDAVARKTQKAANDFKRWYNGQQAQQRAPVYRYQAPY